jgi:hypothetical protein
MVVRVTSIELNIKELKITESIVDNPDGLRW